MGSGPACECHRRKGFLRKRHWRVVDRRCNYSAFNGGHWTPSPYSSLRCDQCRRMWRTKAAYVDQVQDMTDDERRRWLTGRPDA